MHLSLSLTEEQLNDLASIRDLGTSKIERVAAAMRRESPTPLRASRITEIARKELPDDDRAADVLMQTAVSMHGLSRGTGRTISVLRDALLSSLRNSSWSNEEVSKWVDCQTSFLSLVECDAVRLVTNALDLSYEYANLYRVGRIISDIRPLYNDDFSKIQGSVVAFTFRLKYQSSDEEHELSIAMDDEDVRRLKDQCERALVKASTAKQLMISKAEVPTFIAGEDDNG